MLKFLSLTTATQFLLLINQLGLVPLQIRIWGPGATAHWFVVLAMASIATLSDLGLRSAGHAQLLASVRDQDPVARNEFLRTWALTRALIAGLTALVLLFEILEPVVGGGTFEAWPLALTIALVFDMTIIVRGQWLDTLGHFNKVEAVFLCLLAIRVTLSIFALLIFRASPAVLALVMLATAAGMLAVQASLKSSPPELAFLAGGWGLLRWRSLGVIRFVVIEPMAMWTRICLPVIVLAAISSPRVTTMYVAIRSVFGLARQVSAQLARYASVGYVHRMSTDRVRAEALAIRAILGSTVIAVAISSVMIIDQDRVLPIWLHEHDRDAEFLISLTFAAGNIAIGYVVNAGVLTRVGDIAGIARRQSTFLVGSCLAAGVGYLSGSKELYLVLIAAQELLLAGMFNNVLGARIARILVVACSIAAMLLGSLAWIAAADVGRVFLTKTPEAFAISLLAAASTTFLASLACLAIDAVGMERRRLQVAG